MHLVFDIFAGIGIAAAAGVSPFLAALVVGALAAGHVAIHFNHTDYSFLQSAPFLLAMALGVVVIAVVERRMPKSDEPRSPLAYALGVARVVIGALLFDGSLAR